MIFMKRDDDVFMPFMIIYAYLWYDFLGQPFHRHLDWLRLLSSLHIRATAEEPSSEI